MKIAAVVILYHPGDDCATNINSYYHQVDKVYVFDNSEKEASIKPTLLQLSKIEYYHSSHNLGLSKRLNEACQLAINDGFDWLLTMDQDSKFLNDSFVKYLDCFNQFQQKEKVALFGTANKRAVIQSNIQCEFEENICLMTSGTLVNLELFKTIGKFDEALFIDCIDHDYFARAVLAGYKSIQFSSIFLLHHLGNEVYAASIKSFFLIKKRKEVHTPLRLYYMVRNTLYLKKKFGAVNSPTITQLKYDVFSKIKIALLYSRNSKGILTYIRRGYRDYKAGNMGRIALTDE